MSTAMRWDARLVKPLSGYRIYVELENGDSGIFDVKPYLEKGVLRELLDEHYFSQVGIQYGAVTWPHEQDIDPETLLAGLKAGKPENEDAEIKP